MIYSRELILTINLPFEYSEKQHFKISNSDLIPSLGQKTVQQNDVVKVTAQMESHSKVSNERYTDASAQVILLRQFQHIWFSDSGSQNNT